jgi:hypothetical protein
VHIATVNCRVGALPLVSDVSGMAKQSLVNMEILSNGVIGNYFNQRLFGGTPD